ncbi:uncharacterized protein [Symphalangus syndactylus]|uniref:uncharacterized protein n=1 Tax=Symphalangus syndactylus TaxID=9590 RepID=UPI003005EE58
MVWDAESDGRAEERGAERIAGGTGGKGVGKAVREEEAADLQGSLQTPISSPRPSPPPARWRREGAGFRAQRPGAGGRLPSVARGCRLRRGGGGDRGNSLAQAGAGTGPSPTLLWPLPPGSPAPPDPHAATFSPAQRRRGRSLLPSIFQPPIPENQFWDVTEQADIILGPASLGHCSHHATWGFWFRGDLRLGAALSRETVTENPHQVAGRGTAKALRKCTRAEPLRQVHREIWKVRIPAPVHQIEHHKIKFSLL